MALTVAVGMWSERGTDPRDDKTWIIAISDVWPSLSLFKKQVGLWFIWMWKVRNKGLWWTPIPSLFSCHTQIYLLHFPVVWDESWWLIHQLNMHSSFFSVPPTLISNPSSSLSSFLMHKITLDLKYLFIFLCHQILPVVVYYWMSHPTSAMSLTGEADYGRSCHQEICPRRQQPYCVLLWWVIKQIVKLLLSK